MSSLVTRVHNIWYGCDVTITHNNALLPYYPSLTFYGAVIVIYDVITVVYDVIIMVLYSLATEAGKSSFLADI